MKRTDRSIVITGAGSGIGRALAIRFAVERPRGLVLAVETFLILPHHRFSITLIR